MDEGEGECTIKEHASLRDHVQKLKVFIFCHVVRCQCYTSPRQLTAFPFSLFFPRHLQVAVVQLNQSSEEESKALREQIEQLKDQGARADDLELKLLEAETKVLQAQQDVDDLKEEVDQAAEAQDMIEELSEKVMNFEETVKELREQVRNVLGTEDGHVR